MMIITECYIKIKRRISIHHLFSGSYKMEEGVSEPDKLVLEGKIVQRLECKPYGKCENNLFVSNFRAL